MAERCLYLTIDFPYKPEAKGEAFGKTSLPWPLCQTLSRRPDLAEGVKRFDLMITNTSGPAMVPASEILPDGIGFPFASKLEYKFAIPEPLMAGAMLQRLPYVDYLTLHLLEAQNYNVEHRRHGKWPMMRCCMVALFPQFESLTSHLQQPPMPQTCGASPSTVTSSTGLWPGVRRWSL